MTPAKLSVIFGVVSSLVGSSLVQFALAEGLKGATHPTRSRALQDIDLGEIIGFGCFSERATVEVQGRSEPVPIMDLRVGDQVLTNDRSYAPVYAFGHRHTSKLASFVQIQTVQGSLEITPEHLVFLHGEAYPVRADSIQEGDVLHGKDGNSRVEVIEVDNVIRKGVYAPFTTTGTIVVDGIVASSYVALQVGSKDYVQLNNGWNAIPHHTYMHIGLSPLRQVCLGLSPRLCSHDDNEEGMPSYVAFAKKFTHDVHSQSIVVQVMVLLGTVILMTVLVAVESVFGATYAAPR
ncbi:Protein hedgehog [Seminavis robusta]|uniref:Protein hedgehog n=1 Tax=Seminavis robusta TaxID=568900 RepID=A0A9N8H8T2_9STRA|nr:Protein hedgehog [Seminavis robusta]|eukprot:Sro99_g050810.1 Protein hedgehog (292) ;mRNA; f:35466-36446